MAKLVLAFLAKAEEETNELQMRHTYSEFYYDGAEGRAQEDYDIKSIKTLAEISMSARDVLETYFSKEEIADAEAELRQKQKRKRDEGEREEELERLRLQLEQRRNSAGMDVLDRLFPSDDEATQRTDTPAGA